MTLSSVRRTPFNVFCFVVCVVGIVNFMAFFVAAIVIGGDAINGRIDGNRYLLSEHGRLHQVSKEVFEYSLWHARSLFVTHPLAILCAWLLSRDARKNPRR